MSTTTPTPRPIHAGERAAAKNLAAKHAHPVHVTHNPAGPVVIHIEPASWWTEPVYVPAHHG